MCCILLNLTWTFIYGMPSRCRIYVNVKIFLSKTLTIVSKCALRIFMMSKNHDCPCLCVPPWNTCSAQYGVKHSRHFVMYNHYGCSCRLFACITMVVHSGFCMYNHGYTYWFLTCVQWLWIPRFDMCNHGCAYLLLYMYNHGYTNTGFRF